MSLFTGVTLSPPDNIRTRYVCKCPSLCQKREIPISSCFSYIFEDGELMAVLEWDNNMEFEGLETVLNIYDGAKAKSYAMVRCQDM